MMKKLGAILQKFLNLNIKVAFGFEFEFYLTDEFDIPLQNAENFIEKIQNFLTNENFFVYIDKEKEIGQLEICSIATFEVIKNIEKWVVVLEKCKVYLQKENICLNHKAKPFLNKAGNGLHINISLHNSENLENLFGSNNDFRHDIKNELIAYSIGGLLENIEKNINRYLFDESMILRIRNPDRNTPINFSWGHNNRTTMIRIPESLSHMKRIENRLPSSENDLSEVVFLTLNGILEGIENKILPPQCVYGLAFDCQYNLKSVL